ncbi:MAG: PH domain-containing protein [Candidatus Nitrosotenuis sp.]
MELSIADGFLHIKLNWKEKLATFSGSRKILLNNITSIYTDYSRIPNGIRLPGTYIPYIITAGTYYTRSGKEFWYVIKKKNILRLELQNESYARFILGIDDNEFWKQKLGK